MKYLAYRVKDGHGSPGAVVCRPYTQDEAEEAQKAKVVCLGPVTFDAEGNPWPQAYRALGVQ